MLYHKKTSDECAVGNLKQTGEVDVSLWELVGQHRQTVRPESRNMQPSNPRNKYILIIYCIL